MKFIPAMHRIGASIFNSERMIEAGNKIYSPVAKYNLKKYFKKYTPDIVISTFPAGNFTIGELKKDFGFKFITIVTDLTTVHRYWVSPQTDHYSVGLKQMIHALGVHGVKPEQIAVNGFPMKGEFFVNKSKTEIRERLNLKNKFTALYLIGSMPDKFYEELCEKLDQHANIQTIVICGKNKSIEKSLKKKYKNLIVLGFVKNIDEYMRVANTCIGKAGPGFVMECATLGKPVIITSYVAPQEYGNVELVLGQEWGWFEPIPKSIINRIEKIQNMPKEKYKKYCNNALNINPKNSTGKIVKFCLGAD